MTLDLRRTVVERLRADLVGPTSADVAIEPKQPSSSSRKAKGKKGDVPDPASGSAAGSAEARGPNEVIRDRPTDRYVTGILFPRKTKVDEEDDEEYGQEGADNKEAAISGKHESISFGNLTRPSSAGISFAVSSRGSDPTVTLIVRCGTYERYFVDESGARIPDGARFQDGKRGSERWLRTPHEKKSEQTLALGSYERPTGIPGLDLYIKVTAWEGDKRLVTIAVVNEREAKREKVDTALNAFFQAELEVAPGTATQLVARPSRRSLSDVDGKSNALIYRNAREYAVGHTCSATWHLDGDRVASVSTTWLPEVLVKSTSSEGDAVFEKLSAEARSATWIAAANKKELVAALSALPAAYSEWLDAEERRVPTLATDELRTQANDHLKQCRVGLARMKQAIDLVNADETVRQAFQLANQAMVIQRRWATRKKKKPEKDLVWRPFQLGFQLLTLASLAHGDHPERTTMDLLWFPTGGGKTEAYLALTAFVAFLRRIRAANTDMEGGGGGVGILMRYTLRLLTIQQFQRAAKLICACEYIRRGNERPSGTKRLNLGTRLFSLGLWVGGDVTPTTIDEAAEVLAAGDDPPKDPTPKQLKECPACGEETLKWFPSAKPVRCIRCECNNEGCEFAAGDKQVPVFTVDEDVYREQPTLLIGTIDKFAQITRNPDKTAKVFSIDGPHAPPDLIVQDELHLISGPLGTVAGIYELAIDDFCTAKGKGRPKVIGSTATICRAARQIRDLFDRDAYQFPPPVIDGTNSCFARLDPDVPGRLYVGITTAGRSAKYTLGMVAASLLQAATDSRLDDEARNNYWTLVTYFNTLRELGAALVLMQDDVENNLLDFASRRPEGKRSISAPAELTSRLASSEIPEVLKNLERGPGDSSAYDVLLASNMISVGVDIPRLGLMVVHGQPKSIAEYIQTTSRVGRNEVPGLVVTIYNNGKARDRSHFETFRTWHETLYRDVEATSVTPFASRAQDRALHAALVALVRHRVRSMRSDTAPQLSAQQRKDCQPFVDLIVKRATAIDPDEVAGVERKLKTLLDQWEDKSQDGLEKYWDDFGDSIRLMMSAEQVAAIEAAKNVKVTDVWPTLNSMREVEPSTSYILFEKLRVPEDDNGQ